MKCFICDRNLKDLKIDPRDGKIKPCSVCEEIIDENLADLRKADEDYFVYVDSSPEDIIL